MDLDEMLLYTDIKHLHHIVDHYQCQCNRHSKTDIIQSLIYNVFNRSALNQLIYHLDEMEFTFLQLLYLDSRHQFAIEDLIAKGMQSAELHQSAINPKDLVFTALKRGLLFHGVGKEHQLIYLIPNDLKNKIIKILSESMKQELDFAEDMMVYRDERRLLISDTVSFLKYISSEPLLLTGVGNIYKRQQHSIFKTFAVPEEPFKNVVWRFGYGRRYNEYPDRFSLIYDYVFFHHLILEDETGYLYLTEKGNKWLEKEDFEEEEKNIFRFWIRLYKHPIPFLQLITKMIDMVSYQTWLKLESLEKFSLYWIKDHYYEKRDQIFKDRIIKMMLHSGALQIGYDNNEAYIRITEEGHQWINSYSSFDVKEIVLQKSKKS